MELTWEFMNNPTQISVTPLQKTAENVVQVLYHAGREEKFGLLLGLLKREGGSRILIFSNTREEARRLEDRLGRNGWQAKALTGDVEQKKRLKILNDFKNGELPILVATDVASRGLHIEGVTHVVNWDMPQDPEDYVHRIGRTARAGATGKSISLADEAGALQIEPIEKFIGQKIPVEWAEDEWIPARDQADQRGAPSLRRREARAHGRAGRTSGGGGRGGPGGGRAAVAADDPAAATAGARAEADRPAEAVSLFEGGGEQDRAFLPAPSARSSPRSPVRGAISSTFPAPTSPHRSSPASFAPPSWWSPPTVPPSVSPRVIAPLSASISAASSSRRSRRIPAEMLGSFFDPGTPRADLRDDQGARGFRQPADRDGLELRRAFAGRAAQAGRARPAHPRARVGEAGRPGGRVDG